MARKERKGDDKKGEDVDYRDRDLERFLLAGTVKRDVKQQQKQHVFGVDRDLESGLDNPRQSQATKQKRSPSVSSAEYEEHPEPKRERKDRDRKSQGEVLGETMTKENGSILPYLKVDTASTEGFGALDRRDLQGNLKRYMKAWSWVWGGSKYSGATCMAISSFSYALMGLFVKLLAVRSFPSSQIVMFRCAFISLIAGTSLRKMRHPLLGSPRVRKLVIARAVVGFFSLSAFFYSIQILPLRDATVLNFTTPVFTVILATLYLNEIWGAAEAAGTFCSFVGVLLVTQPDFLSSNHALADSIRDTYMGVAIALIAAATGALSYIIVRMIGQTSEPPLVCVFAFAAFSTPMAALGTMMQGYKVPDSTELALLLSVGIMAYFAQVFLTRALQLEKASSVTPIQYLKVLFTFILGVVFLQEIPTLWDVLGAVLIAGSAASISYKSRT
ncbi:hypothetical protein R1flu_020379 [Riccia fluitans]|uniref:EamA domain-containing protein n=1 Tax=Riccia fluitans TaxID=41844 RepID=A0ABD1ZNH4_9MARC